MILHFYDIPLLIGEKPLNCKITATRLIDKIFCNIIVFPLILFISHPEIVILIFRNIYYTPLRNPKIPISRKDEFTLSRNSVIPKRNNPETPEKTKSNASSTLRCFFHWGMEVYCSSSSSSHMRRRTKVFPSPPSS